MSTSEQWQPAWIARGTFRDQRFELPAGMSSVTFDRARLANVDFSGMRFTDFNAHGSEFDGCDFSSVIFEDLSMGITCMGGPWDRDSWPQSVFRDCVFRRTRFPPRTDFGNVRFERCVFDRSRLRGQTSTFEAEFVDCVFVGGVREVNFWGRPTEYQDALGRDRNAFTGNDFTGAQLDYVAFRHIDLHAQRFPGLPGHALLDRISERVERVLPLLEHWPDAGLRQEATSSLDFLAHMARENNGDEALVSPLDMGRKLPPALREELFEVFRHTTSDTSPA